MRKITLADRSPAIVLDATASTPLYKQLYEGLRGAVLTGQLKTGARLPSTRAFAAELSISRATVQLAFEQLIAEGYLQGHTGSGTFVASTFPPESVVGASHNASPGQSGNVD